MGPSTNNRATDVASIRVVVADDHKLTRQTLCRLLNAEQDIEVVGEAEDLVASIAQVHLECPDVLVLDFQMSDGPSSGVIRELRMRSPNTKAVVLSMDDEPAFARVALAAGALGFVRKEFADGELAQAIRAAADGKVYVSPQIAAGRIGSP